jgi:hypothetical protein
VNLTEEERLALLEKETKRLEEARKKAKEMFG